MAYPSSLPLRARPWGATELAVGKPAQFDEQLRKATPNASQHRSTILDRPPVLSRLLLLWSALALLSGAATLINTPLGLSLLWGCSVSLLPSVCFAWYGLRKYGGAQQSLAMVRAVYRAEGIKFFLTAAMFAAVFIQVDKIYLPVFFLAFVFGQIASWLVTAQVLVRHQR